MNKPSPTPRPGTGRSIDRSGYDEHTWLYIIAMLFMWICGVLCGLLFFGAFGCNPVPPPPEPPEQPEATCAESCSLGESWGCKWAEPVCSAFDDEGRCFERVNCDWDCEHNPQAHPSPACVLDVVSADAGDPCAIVDERCW